jgi:hypothetical protein
MHCLVGMLVPPPPVGNARSKWSMGWELNHNLAVIDRVLCQLSYLQFPPLSGDKAMIMPIP